MIEGYDSVEKIGDMLTETIPSNNQVETIAGLTAAEGPGEVGEGQEYNDSTFAEKYVTATNTKYGRIISITEETLYFDKTGQIMSRAMDIGQKAAQYRFMNSCIPKFFIQNLFAWGGRNVFGQYLTNLVMNVPPLTHPLERKIMGLTVFFHLVVGFNLLPGCMVAVPDI